MSSCETDFLIVGSGIAGLVAAYRAKEYGSVMIITKEKAQDSNTEKAQGGIAAAIDSKDSPFLHLEDTLGAGAGFCDTDVVEILVNEGPARVMELVDMGVCFDREGSAWVLGQEGAHSKRRILHASDATGWEISKKLIDKCRSDKRITLKEGSFLVDLLRDSRTGRCRGGLFMDSLSGEFSTCHCGTVILATGGAGRLYENTTNPAVATGDGMAAAYRAGAVLMDMEFVQFHPTALSVKGLPRFLISEAVRGEGAFLRNINGERFMLAYHERAELAPRDVVSRAIVTEMRKTGSDHVNLDFSHLDRERFKKRFPNICRTCDQYSVDLSEGLIPVAPAAHYIMGGVAADKDCKTSIPGLYACGEVACNGVHGANRLASNSLLEGLVFGVRAAEHAKGYIEHNFNDGDLQCNIEERVPDWDVSWQSVASAVRSLMWDKVGIVRTESDLIQAIAELEKLKEICPAWPTSRRGVEAQNLLTLGLLAARAALMRKESRGGHFREDYPCKDDKQWMRHIILQR
ncbi:MAG: L-aspartate oxidase [Syntrophaceticus sp.]|nr:L-aspartate oxidase [Syntrophaceticus sp.]MDD3314009.1 L-aspartate oxidase [Syntrophaceticus sp.]MDD4359318.1 L-aspartate oxidase [Syntrophaceticus sp.]MDD4782278.1 L-aspartate oxidase [Syntrophaceticus sp.]